MGEIEERIHHKMISLYRRTGLDADTILLDQKTYLKFRSELAETYRDMFRAPFGSESFTFKGMKVFYNPLSEEPFIELLPLKQLKENKYV